MKYLTIKEWSTWIQVKVFTEDEQYAFIANNLAELLKIVRKERLRHGLDLRIEREDVGRFGTSLWFDIMSPTKEEARVYHHRERHHIGKGMK